MAVFSCDRRKTETEFALRRREILEICANLRNLWMILCDSFESPGYWYMASRPAISMI